MKRQIFVLAMAVVLAMATVLIAQTNSGTTPLPPSQQVDPSGHPETGTGPDVDVDVGKNANNGVLNVDVKRHTDPDTKAQGNTPTTNTTGTTTTTTDTTGTTTPTMGTTGTTTTTTDTTGTTQSNNSTTTTDTTTDTGMTRHHLPRTGSEMPLFGLAGLLSLAGACVLRASR